LTPHNRPVSLIANGFIIHNFLIGEAMKRQLFVISVLIGLSFQQAHGKIFEIENNNAKEILLTILRDKNTTASQFRLAGERLSYFLASEVSNHLKKEEITIETQLAKAKGYRLTETILFVPIVRSGITLLNPFLKFFSDMTETRVGFIGLERDEETAIARLYYKKIPEVKPSDRVIVLEPILATGGSACDAIKVLKESGIEEERIIFVTAMSATQGLERVKKEFPGVDILTATIDEKLNDKKFIVPGLGDWGDRIYGTEELETVVSTETVVNTTPTPSDSRVK
jgi:uracil phosphoribosyltransferase